MVGWWKSTLMRQEFDEMLSFQNYNMTKCQVDKMRNWQMASLLGGKLIKCQVDKMACGQNDKWTKLNVDKIPNWSIERLTKCQVDKMTQHPSFFIMSLQILRQDVLESL